MSQPRTHLIRLPCFGIIIRLDRKNTAETPGGGTISSDLRIRGENTLANRQYNTAIDGLEALILAHACAGLEVQAPAYVEGIETAVEAIANHLS
jgi:hypothetical protein